MDRSTSKALRTVVAGCLGVAVIAWGAGCTSVQAPARSTSGPAATGSATANPTGISPDTRFTPLMVSALNAPMPVRGTDDRTHLAYELLVTNATSLPLRLDRLEVRDAASRATILALDAAQLQQFVTPLAGSNGTASGPVLIGPGETRVAWLDVQLAADAKVPTGLEHRASGALIIPQGDPAAFDAAVGTTPVDARQPITLAMPVKDGIWYMSEGCCTDDTHHRRGLAPINGTPYVPQRFAIDFFLLDDQHRTWTGDPAKLTSYLTYRQPIAAAAAGTVVSARDGIPNTTSLPEPPPLPPIENTVGNHVIVKIAEGVYALYGHMDPGSVRVKVGDRVEQGQELGLIGSSGNSTTPHLHFQLQTEPTFFPTDSLPFGFDRFELMGRVPDRIWDDNLGLQPTGQLPFESLQPSTRQNQLPLDRTVIRQVPAK